MSGGVSTMLPMLRAAHHPRPGKHAGYLLMCCAQGAMQASGMHRWHATMMSEASRHSPARVRA